MAGKDKGARRVVVSKVCISLCSLAMRQRPCIMDIAAHQQVHGSSFDFQGSSIRAGQSCNRYTRLAAAIPLLSRSDSICAGQLRALNLGGWDLRCTWASIASSVAELKDLVTLDLSNNAQLTVCNPSMREPAATPACALIVLCTCPAP